jgi:hypothetical protein
VAGAAIALVASVVGGFMSSVIGPLLSRRAETKDRELAASTERWSVIQATILEASLGLRAYSVARHLNRVEDITRVMHEVENHMIRLRLWTSDDEKDVADRLMHVLSIDDIAETSAAAWAWERVAARWFRKTVSDADFAGEYDKARADRLAFEKALRGERAEETGGNIAP